MCVFFSWAIHFGWFLMCLASLPCWVLHPIFGSHLRALIHEGLPAWNVISFSQKPRCKLPSPVNPVQAKLTYINCARFCFHLHEYLGFVGSSCCVLSVLTQREQEDICLSGPDSRAALLLFLYDKSLWNGFLILYPGFFSGWSFAFRMLFLLPYCRQHSFSLLMLLLLFKDYRCFLKF